MPLLVLNKMIRDASPAKALGFVGLGCREEPVGETVKSVKSKSVAKVLLCLLKESVQ